MLFLREAHKGGVYGRRLREAEIDAEDASRAKTKLHKACRAGAFDHAERYLREHPEWAKERDEIGCSALHYAAAAKGDNTNIVDLLLTVTPGHAAAMDDAERTVLHYAAAQGRVAATRVLLGTKEGAAAVKMKDFDGKTPATLAKKYKKNKC